MVNALLVLLPLGGSGFSGESTYFDALCSSINLLGSEKGFISRRTMAAPMNKYICLLTFLVVVGIAGFKTADGAGECPGSNPDMEAYKMMPCASAAQDKNADVSSSCCAQVKKLGQNARCLCAVMLSNTVKMSGIKPEIAMTIPKRCNLADRPVGYKCGAYTLP